MREGTRTYSAFRYVLNNVVGVMRYDKSSYKTLILVTDGHANDDHLEAEMQGEFLRARQMFASQIVMGVGPEIDRQELTNFASSSAHVIEVSSYRELNDDPQVNRTILKFLQAVLPVHY